MVGDVATNDLVAIEISPQLVVVASQFPGTLIRLSATGGEEDAIEIAGGEARESLGQLNGFGMRVGPSRKETELANLRSGGFADVAASMAEGAGVKSPAKPSKYSSAIRAVDPGAFAAHHDGDLIVLVVSAESRHLQPEMATSPLRVLMARVFLIRDGDAVGNGVAKCHFSPMRRSALHLGHKRSRLRSPSGNGSN